MATDLKEKHEDRKIELQKSVEDMPTTIGKTYALCPARILSHMLGREDIVEDNKEYKLIVYQQDLLTAFFCLKKEEWTIDCGDRLCNLIAHVLLMPSEKRKIPGIDLLELRKSVCGD